MMTLFDSLYCQEENHQWLDDENDSDVDNVVLEHDEQESSYNNSSCSENPHITPHDLIWEDQELATLITKESSQHFNIITNNHRSCSTMYHRHEAVEWILEVVSHYSFRALTAVLAVNYLDRFFDKFEGDKKPWMTQLVCVSCLSLAAKVEETHVPLLLDLQLDGSKYVFEAKTIQKMEILILSTLEWRMNPVTPLSFLDYMTHRLGLEAYLSLEFLKRCECLLLCILPDERFRCFLPSVIATATMVHVINSVEPCVGVEYQSQLLGILGINKEHVEECWKQIQEITCSRNSGRVYNKRKFGAVPGSPDAVMDLSFSSDESWSVVNPSVPSSPEPGPKKIQRSGSP